MPETTTTIDRHQREGLYELIRNHLAGLGDVWTAMEQEEDFVAAERLGLEFAEDVRLLGDIGWDPGESRAEFELTMPADDLEEALNRLQREAARLLTESPHERRSREEEEEEVTRRFRAGHEACEATIAAIAENGGDRR